MSGESKKITTMLPDVADNRMLADVTDAYLKATSDAIAKGKSSEWASANSILLEMRKKRRQRKECYKKLKMISLKKI